MAFSSLLVGSIALLVGIFLLYPVPGIDELKTLFLDWISFTPWDQSSINTYLGTITSKSRFFPVPVMASLLALSLLAYAVLLLVSRTNLAVARKSFDWRVAATLTIVCWLSLDLLWQARLLQRLHDTHADFYGVEPVKKLSAAPDGQLFNFIARVKQKAEGSGARFFLATSSDYLGVRGSYHLYPENVYWKRHAPELPNKRFLHSGDYVVLVRPTVIRFDRNTNSLLIPKTNSLPDGALAVEPLIVENAGGLFRVR